MSFAVSIEIAEFCRSFSSKLCRPADWEFQSLLHMSPPPPLPSAGRRGGRIAAVMRCDSPSAVSACSFHVSKIPIAGRAASPRTIAQAGTVHLASPGPLRPLGQLAQQQEPDVRGGATGGGGGLAPVPFLEKWGGPLAVQPRWRRRTNVWRRVTNPRGVKRLRSGWASTVGTAEGSLPGVRRAHGQRDW